jgi:hypothetical protein
MALIIDGYNLLHATGIVGRGLGPGGLERARAALLNFLAASVDPRELPRTVVVFDAREAPSGRPRIVEHKGLTVRFASGHESADALIEELVRGDSSPRRLTVVSSDHRVQRAARRRKATAVDSDRWFAELAQARRERSRAAASGPAARPGDLPLDPAQVEYWLAQFGGGAGPATDKPPGEGDETPLDDPFPPGYAEGLTEDDV